VGLSLAAKCCCDLETTTAGSGKLGLGQISQILQITLITYIFFVQVCVWVYVCVLGCGYLPPALGLKGSLQPWGRGGLLMPGKYLLCVGGCACVCVRSPGCPR